MDATETNRKSYPLFFEPSDLKNFRIESKTKQAFTCFESIGIQNGIFRRLIGNPRLLNPTENYRIWFIIYLNYYVIHG